ncbi:hypothetical protein SEA_CALLIEOMALLEY_2 [Arthrobacter phage CallieOMalley]|uniref:Minor tail protein n=1 Tax=Arthrobacter phage CallieOMalley TaxID=2488955 RepID=A0A3G8FSB2_9CAUD|nr:hypothetical protein SEA_CALLIEOMALLEY_2 [Arthrobacter phage CallieOMalley]
MARTPDDPTKAQVWIDNTDPLNPLFEFYFPKGAKGDPGGIVNPSALGAGYDWNNLIVSGLYYATGSDMAGMPNSPPSMAVGVNIMVTARNAAVVTQIAWTTSNSHNQIQFMRSLVSGTWGPWKVIRNTNIDNTAGKAVYTWDETSNRSQLIYGDTGWRDVTALFPTVTSGSVLVRRIGYAVYFKMNAIFTTAGGNQVIGTLPDGFRPNFADTEFLGHTGTGAPVRVNVTTNGNMTGYTLTTAHLITYSGSIAVSQPWPATLPGTAVGTIPNL